VGRAMRARRPSGSQPIERSVDEEPIANHGGLRMPSGAARPRQPRPAGSCRRGCSVEKSAEESSSMAATILTGNDLEKRYVSDLIFSGVTFQVTEGERVGVVGPNGTGKSTLLKSIAGLEHPSGGSLSTLRGLRATDLP